MSCCLYTKKRVKRKPTANLRTRRREEVGQVAYCEFVINV